MGTLTHDSRLAHDRYVSINGFQQDWNSFLHYRWAIDMKCYGVLHLCKGCEGFTMLILYKLVRYRDLQKCVVLIFIFIHLRPCRYLKNKHSDEAAV